MEMKRAVHRGATLVVADPRAVWMTTIADKHLQLNPGTDVWLLNALAHVICAEGLVDEEFIAENTEGFEAVRETVARYTPEEAEKVTGVSAEDIRWTARRYAKTAKAGIYYTLGITEHSHGTDNVYALANLVLMTGHLGKPSAGMNPLRGQNNVQGANDAGATPVFYPGYQRVDDPEVRAKYERSWGVELSPDPGMNLNVMMKQVGKSIRGLFVMGEDIVLSEPNCMELEKGLNANEFLVLQEPFMNETARFADVIFPAAVFAEKEARSRTPSVASSACARRSSRRARRARTGRSWCTSPTPAEPTGATRARPRCTTSSPRDAPKFTGISHARIDDEVIEGRTGIQWPCPTPDHPGTTFLHEEGVLRGKGLFQAVDYRPSEELPDEEYGLVLSTGRTLYHYNCATQTRRESGLVAKQPEAFVEIHPRDAKKRGIADQDLVEVRTRRGAIRVRAVYSRQVRPGLHLGPAALRRGAGQRRHERCRRPGDADRRVQGLRGRGDQGRVRAGRRGALSRQLLRGRRSGVSLRSTALATLLLSALACSSPVEWGEHTEQRMARAVSGQQLDYWLYTPPASETAPPLLLFLHGAGERGEDLALVKTHGPPRLIGQREELAGYVVVSPQCPSNDWWQSDTLAALVAEVLAAEPRIDEERLYVTGLSMGGYGTWNLIVDHPELFAAAVPICGGGDPNRLDPDPPPDVEPEFRLEDLERVRDLPIWVFHGEQDAVVPVEETTLLVEALDDLGSDVRVTIYPRVGHASWRRAYADPELYAWLSAQRKRLR